MGNETLAKRVVIVIFVIFVAMGVLGYVLSEDQINAVDSVIGPIFSVIWRVGTWAGIAITIFKLFERFRHWKKKKKGPLT